MVELNYKSVANEISIEITDPILKKNLLIYADYAMGNHEKALEEFLSFLQIPEVRDVLSKVNPRLFNCLIDTVAVQLEAKIL